MSTIKKQYRAAEKIRISLEAIKGELTTAQISSKYGVRSYYADKQMEPAGN